MQSDGNLVLYTQAGRVLWNSGTQGNPGARAVMQSDGNLVVYSTSSQPLWNSGTSGHRGAGLTVQDDGNVVIYDGQTAAWATYTVQNGLGSGDRLLGGQSVSSPSGHHRLVMQGDGNLVMYTEAGRAIWNSVTNGNAGAWATMQGDGNFVVYSSSNSPLWNSATNGHPGATLAVQDDGNLVVYQGSTAVWATYSIDARIAAGEKLTSGQAVYAPGGRYFAAMQGDGNFVLYATGGRALWSSQTNGHPGAYVTMQSDGNLVVYAGGGGPALWQSGTAGHPGSYFTVQDDGNAVIYQNGAATFNTNTVQAPAPTTTGSPTTVGEQAARGAEARLGQVYTSENPNANYWSGYCETFAWLVYGGRARYPSAIADYNDRAAHGLIHGGAPPRGALVFYGGGGGYGHVTIGVGGGQVVGTLGYATERRPISRTSYTYFGHYLGWALPY